MEEFVHSQRFVIIFFNLPRVESDSHMVSAHYHLLLDVLGHAGDLEAARVAGVHRWPGFIAISEQQSCPSQGRRSCCRKLQTVPSSKPELL